MSTPEVVQRPARLDLRLYRGDRFPVAGHVELELSTGDVPGEEPLDLSGWTLQASASAGTGGWTIEAQVLSAAAGRVALVIPADITAALPRRALWRLAASSPDTHPRTLVAGDLWTLDGAP